MTPRPCARRAEIALAREGPEAAEALLANGPPDDPALAKLRGRLALLHRDGSEAVRQFQLARAALPQDREALSGLATALRLTGRPDEARQVQAVVEALDRAAALLQQLASSKQHQNPGLWTQIGLAYEDAGLDPQARAWLRLVLSQNPDDRSLRQALLRLRSHPESRLPTPGIPKKGDKLGGETR